MTESTTKDPSKPIPGVSSLGKELSHLNLIENLNTFLIKFPKFDSKYSVQFQKKKKSSVKKKHKEMNIKFKNNI